MKTNYVNVDLIRHLMLDHNHKLKDLAKICNTTVNGVSLRLAGKRKFTIEELVKIKKEYEVSLDDLTV